MKTIASWRRLAGVVLAVAGMTFSGLAKDESRGGQGQGLVQRIATQLDLTEDQQAQIKDIFAAEKTGLQALAERLRDTRTGLRDAIHAPGATENTVRAAAAKVAAVEADLAVERLKLYGQISPLLTDGQREKLVGLEQHLDQVIDTFIARPAKAAAN